MGLVSPAATAPMKATSDHYSSGTHMFPPFTDPEALTGMMEASKMVLMD